MRKTVIKGRFNFINLRKNVFMKPESILKLEKEFGVELSLFDGSDLYNLSRNTYILDENNEVLGLNLYHNNIQDISILKDYKKLQFLDLSYNERVDFSILKNLDQLTDLLLRNNSINDISFLKDFKKLTRLVLSDNNISSVSYLKKAKLLKVLDLNCNKIKNISIIKEFKQLTNLDLSNNLIENISSLKDLIKLKDLNLNSNRIVDVFNLENLIELSYLELNDNKVIDISHLKKMEMLIFLDLSKNKIVDLMSLKKINKLKILRLSHNSISDISILKNFKGLTHLDLKKNLINDISNLKSLKNLESLFLNYNKINDISHLKDLRKLVKLNLSNNQIAEIVDLKNLFNLKFLELESNKVKNIVPLDRLINLSYLALNSNLIVDISPLKSLTKLSILKVGTNKINKINGLKSVIEKLHNLENIDISNNLLNLPENCLKDVKYLKTYLKDGEKGTTDYRYVKLLFLGDGCVGKSTLLNHLIFLTPPKAIPIDDRTEGVKLDIWQDVLPNVKVNVWDFGGQEVMHSTHRLFLGENAVYILVWCKENNKLCSQSETHNLKYWLDFIADYGRKSTVLLVENVINSEFDISEFPDEYALMQLIENYKEREIELVATQYRFDCKNNTDEVENFKDVIKNKIKSVFKKYPIEDYPTNWFEFQEALEIEKLKSKIISLEKYYEIANQFELSEPSILLAYFNKIGVLKYIEEFSRDTIILQQEWILEAIYTTIRLKDNPLIRTKGKLLKDDFKIVWSNYSQNERNLFIGYMQRTNLLSARNNKIKRDYDYLCPALFEKKRFDTIIWEEKKEFIIIKFQFVFGAIMQQLQVQILNYCHVEEEEFFYKNYICFKDYTNSLAWVEMIEERRELRIYSENKSTVRTILNEIDEIYPLERTLLVNVKNSKETEFKYERYEDLMFNKSISNDQNFQNEENINSLKVFVTYSWSDEKGSFDEDHQYKVGRFVNQLRTNWGIDASFDLHKTETNFIKMMYENLYKNEKIIIVLSEGYAKRANEFKGGVGTEYQAIINDISQNPAKYIFVSFEERNYKIYPFGFQGNDTILIDEDLVIDNLPENQNRLLSKITDDPIVDIPEISRVIPKVKKIKFDKP